MSAEVSTRSSGQADVADPRQRVLVVEDDPAASGVIDRLLRHYEFSVIAATTRRDALAALSDEIDYLVLDLNLPDGDGLDVLRGVRERNLKMRVAVVTGVQDRQRLRQVTIFRPDLLLLKPLDFLQLLAHVRQRR